MKRIFSKCYYPLHSKFVTLEIRHDSLEIVLSQKAIGYTTIVFKWMKQFRPNTLKWYGVHVEEGKELERKRERKKKGGGIMRLRSAAVWMLHILL